MIVCEYPTGRKANLRHVVVHAIVEQDDKILLIKRADHLTLEPGKWGILSGYLERGETAEEGVIRELKEETGWEGEVISLFRINSSPKRRNEVMQNVALEYLVKPLKRVGKLDSETAAIKWVHVDDLNLNDMGFDFAESLKHYLTYRVRPHALPIVG